MERGEGENVDSKEIKIYETLMVIEMRKVI